MAGPVVARAEIDVDVDGSGVPKQIDRIAKSAGKQLDKEMGENGQSAGKEFGDGFGDSAGRRMTGIARRVATDFGDEFETSVMPSMDDASDGMTKQFEVATTKRMDAVAKTAAMSFGDEFETQLTPRVKDVAEKSMVPMRKSWKDSMTDLGTISAEEYAKAFKNGSAQRMPALGRSVAGDVHDGMTKTMPKVGNDAGNSFGDGFEGGVRKRLSNIGDGGLGGGNDRFTKAGSDAGKSFGGGFDQGLFPHMDRTLKLVLGLILAVGPQMATLGSGVAAAAVALLSSALVGLGGALAALAPVAIGAAWGLGLAIKGIQDLKEANPGAIDGLEKLKNQIGNDAKAFVTQFAPALDTFTESLTKLWRADKVGQSLGEAFGQIATAFDAVINSPAYVAFQTAMETTIPAALVGFGNGVAGVTSGLLTLFAAGGQMAQAMGEAFAVWGQQFAATMATMAADGTLQHFFDVALQSMTALMGLLLPLGQGLGEVFLIGAEFGNRMLSTLGGLAQKFLDWTQSVEGSTAISAWFAAGEQIFNALLPVIESISTALSSMVTPQTIAAVVTFLGTLAEIIPIFGQVLATIGQADILNIVAEAFKAILLAVQPMLPAIGDLLGLLGGVLIDAFKTLTPTLIELGQALAPLIAAFAGALGPILEAIVPVLGDAAGVISSLLAAIVPLIPLMSEWWNILSRVAVTLIEAMGPNLDTVAALIEQMVPVTIELAKAFLDIAPALIPLIEQLPALLAMSAPLIPLFIQLGALFIDIMVPAVRLFGLMLKALLPALEQMTWGLASLATVGTDLMQGLADGISDGITWVTDVLKGLGEAMVAVFKDFFGIASPSTVFLDFGKDILQGLLDGLDSMLDDVLAFFSGLPQMVIDAVTPLVTKIGTWIAEVFTRLRSGAEAGWAAASGFFSGLPGRVIDAVGTLLTRIKAFGSDAMEQLKAGFEAGWTSVSSWVSGIGAKIVTAIGTVTSTLKQAGIDIIGGFLKGLQQKFTDVTTWVSGLGKTLASLKGPKAYDLQLLVPAGGWIMTGLQNGLLAQMPALRRTVAQITGAMNITPALGSAGGLNFRGAAMAAGNTTGAGRSLSVAPGAIVVNVPTDDPQQAANAVLDRLVARWK